VVKRKTKRMLVLELNATEKHFLDKYVAEGKLPVFKKLLQAGRLIKTCVGSSASPLTPWTVWPSIYTGMKPEQHDIVGFGQTHAHFQGQYIWDVLNARGITTDVFRALKILPVKYQMAIFKVLYRYYKPQFAKLHLDHIAAAQQLYWRAAEPENFSDEMGELDKYYFGNNENRKSHESCFKDLILESFKLTDKFIGNLLALLDEKTVLVIMTGLGQKKRDPFHQIHKPKVRFYHFESLLRLNDVFCSETLMQKNPQITLNFKDASDASLGAFKLSNLSVLGEYPLFKIEQRGHQLFLEENLSPAIWILGQDVWVENKLTEAVFPLFNYIKLSPFKDQQTADYSSEGWILLYGNIVPFPATRDILDITEIYPLLLNYFDDRI
jgi:hypothetical protein